MIATLLLGISLIAPPGDTAKTYSAWTCGRTEEAICNAHCIDEAFFAGRTLLRSTCQWTERLELRCGCTFEPLGPYIPPCYFFCSGGRIAIGY